MQEITFAELDTEMVAMLPSKETLFLNFNWANVYATNSSIALNAATLLSQANSAAMQNVWVSQH
ncbi:hypothetical protein N864_17475 [Intrasporangium chromatireducens Q5-1]|uniref:Uncharacterized protein n=1 Tax=Intrasporangium chromatireducens Q5-1 TaxID=584657 RepID=W9GSB2_9MICO|nr:hypothetical protein [Intrasporangium chromatireducens]EWT06784.1 hypothetical protein N864_17475 [Intrasporangium chromatireducens Q5-1]